MIPKLAKGGVINIDIPIDKNITKEITGFFMTQAEMIKEIQRQKKIIDHLSRVIQNKNKKYRKLEVKKMPPTLYGREVVIVPNSMMDKIAVVNKDFFNFDMGSDKE